ENLAGKRVRCRHCGKIMAVPALGEDVAPGARRAAHGAGGTPSRQAASPDDALGFRPDEPEKFDVAADAPVPGPDAGLDDLNETASRSATLGALEHDAEPAPPPRRTNGASARSKLAKAADRHSSMARDAKSDEYEVNDLTG